MCKKNKKKPHWLKALWFFAFIVRNYYKTEKAYTIWLLYCCPGSKIEFGKCALFGASGKFCGSKQMAGKTTPEKSLVNGKSGKTLGV